MSDKYADTAAEVIARTNRVMGFVQLCQSYERPGVLCSIAPTGRGVEIFCAIDAYTESFILTPEYVKYRLTREGLKLILAIMFRKIQNRMMDNGVW